LTTLDNYSCFGREDGIYLAQLKTDLNFDKIYGCNSNASKFICNVNKKNQFCLHDGESVKKFIPLNGSNICSYTDGLRADNEEARTGMDILEK